MLEIGQPAPDFALPNQNGEIIRLSDLRGKKVVIFAFPKAGTAGCTTQACEFRDEFPAISGMGAVVLGVSGDTQADLESWKVMKRLPYDLLSDTEHTMLEEYGAWGVSVLGLIRMPKAFVLGDRRKRHPHRSTVECGTQSQRRKGASGAARR